ncbi:MAG TPA: winged helix-turn-helix transcriptional regulator [Solirubrobacteraceae bacterium]
MPQVPPPKRHPYDQWSPDARALDLVGDKWSLLIVRDLSAGPRRFVELQRVLPGISTEQLRSRLNRMVADGLLTRQRFREVPPRVEYGLTERAKELMPVLAALAKWGYDWAWSPPRSGEAIDLGAIFRLIPGLLSPQDLSGSITLAVRWNGEQTSYTVLEADGEIAFLERDEGQTTAQIAGTTSAWIRALSPEHDRRELEISGDAELAGRLIAALAGAPAPAQAPAAAGATAAA